MKKAEELYEKISDLEVTIWVLEENLEYVAGTPQYYIQKDRIDELKEYHDRLIDEYASEVKNQKQKRRALRLVMSLIGGDEWPTWLP